MGVNQPIKNSIDYQKFFSNELKNLLEYIDTTVVSEHKVLEITPEVFILAGLERNDCMLYKAVNGFLNSISIDNIRGRIEKMVEEVSLSAIKPTRKIDTSGELKMYFNKANNERVELNHPAVTSDHILLVILKQEGNNPIKNEFEKEGLTYNTLKNLSNKLHNVTEVVYNGIEDAFAGLDLGAPEGDKTIRIIAATDDLDSIDFASILGLSGKPSQAKSPKTTSNVKTNYCTNLNTLAENGTIGTLIGREGKISQISRIFARKKCNNVILVGESGVGKTAIVEGLAKQIVDEVGPYFLRNSQILRLNTTELLGGGTQFRGVFEDRMNTLIKNLKNAQDTILFIDDMHSLVNDKKNADFDFISCLGDVLDLNTVKVIATTTTRGYKTIFDNNDPLCRKFQRIDVEATNDEDTYKILNGIKNDYETFHNVKFSDESLKTCINLAKRYIPDRNLPTSAIDIMDEAGSINKTTLKNSETFKTLRYKLSGLKKEKNAAVIADDMNKAEEIDKYIEEAKLNLAALENNLMNDTKCIEVEDIYQAVAIHTNMAISQLTTSDKQTISNAEQFLKKHIIGQDEAISIVAKAIQRNKVGLHQSNKPMGSFMCIGSTGCGKTLLAKMLAKELFGSENNLIRLDMSEYADKTSVNKLIGSSAGYVGYEKGGVLTEAVKNKKRAVLLIDEIEKANEEVYNIFLQILDEGFLSDNTGRKVDFKNVIIIMTSNVGTKEASLTKAIGFNPDYTKSTKSIIEKNLKQKFPPEFINRFDDIIYFNTLTEGNLKDIIRLELDKLANRVKNIKHTLTYDDSVIDAIYKVIEKEKEYGARPINRVIQNDIENKITDLLIENDYKQHTFEITIENDTITVK